jgi:hypothetical protein
MAIEIIENLSPTFLTILSVTLLVVFPMMLYPLHLLRWLQRKRYQYEVTFGLYMMTPTEKFILSKLCSFNRL